MTPDDEPMTPPSPAAGAGEPSAPGVEHVAPASPPPPPPPASAAAAPPPPPPSLSGAYPPPPPAGAYPPPPPSVAYPPPPPPSATGSGPALPPGSAGRIIGRGAALGGLAYAALVVLATVVLVALALLGLVTSGGGPTDVLQEETPSSGGSLTALLGLPFLLAATSLLAPVDLSLTGMADAGGSLFAPTLSLTALLVALLWLLTGTVARATTVRERWATAGVTGAVLGLAAALFGAIFAIRVGGAEMLGTGLRIGAAPWAAFVGGAAVGTLGAALGLARSGRRTDLTRLGLGRSPIAVRRGLDALAVGAVPVTVLLTLLVVVGMTAEAGVAAAAAVLLLVLPTVLVWLASVAGLAGLTGSGMTGLGGGSETVTVVGEDTPALMALLVLVPLLGALVAGMRLHLAHGRLRHGWSDVWVMPAILGAAGLIGQVLTTVAVEGEASLPFLGDLGGSVTVRPAAWTFLVAALWGLLAEVAARTAAPYALALLPGPVVRAFGRGIPADPAPAVAAWGPAAPSQPGVVVGPGGAAVPNAGPGQAWPQPPGPSGHPGHPPAAPQPVVVSRRAALLVGGGALALLVLVVGGVVAREMINTRVYSPVRPVEAYVAALADGDVSAAFAVAEPDVARGDRVLLTDEFYADVEGRPTNPRVQEPVSLGDWASVTVLWDVDGREVEERYELERAGRTALGFDEWRLVPPRMTELDLGFRLAEDVRSVVVNGVEVDLPGSGSIPALPGRYEVTLPDAGEYLTASTVEVTVNHDLDFGPSLDGFGTLEYTVADAAVAEAEAQALAVLEPCRTATDVEPAGCPFDDWGWEAEDVVGGSWTITTEPTVLTDVYNRSIDLQVIDGVATFSGTLPAEPDSFFGREADEPYSNDVDFSYYMYFEVTPDGVVLTDHYGY